MGAAAFAAALLLAGCDGRRPEEAAIAVPLDSGAALLKEGSADGYKLTAKLPEEETVRIAFTGDVMVHYAQLLRAYDGENGTFDFSPSFRLVAPMLRSADLAIGNLETTFGLPGTARVANEETAFMGYSGFPCFNTPATLADALADAGFDLLALANNHCLDTEEAGLAATLEALAGRELAAAGASEGQERPYVLVKAKGMTLAIVNWTYGINGFSTTEGSGVYVNSFDQYSSEGVDRLLAAIRTAKASGADQVVAFMHWGHEYRQQPDAFHQVPLGDAMLEAGADAVIGSHPHVVQPISGGHLERGKVAAYSLGNFLSSQTSLHLYGGAPTDIGLVLTLEYRGMPGKGYALEGFHLMPTAVFRRQDEVLIVPAFDGKGTQAANGLTASETERLSYAAREIPALVMGEDWHRGTPSPYGLYFPLFFH